MSEIEQRVIRYVGGPWDGEEAAMPEWSDADAASGAYLVVEGWTDRAAYGPRPGGDVWEWHYQGPVAA